MSYLISVYRFLFEAFVFAFEPIVIAISSINFRRRVESHFQTREL
jgi:hypothetical protein